MRRILLSAAAVAALGLASLQSASAADIPAPVYKAAPVAVFTWTGCYVGGHVGGLWGKKDWYFTGIFDGSNEPSGWLGGIQGGCDYQAGSIVFGIQGDWAWADASASNPADPAGTFAPGVIISSKLKSLSSVTGRVGYAWSQALGYVKGGGAWVRDEYTVVGPGGTDSASETRSGWTVGVGGEYAFAPNVSAFVEYNYYDFGTRAVPFYNAGAFVYSEDIKQRVSTVKVGVNWRFGGMH